MAKAKGHPKGKGKAKAAIAKANPKRCPRGKANAKAAAAVAIPPAVADVAAEAMELTADGNAEIGTGSVDRDGLGLGGDLGSNGGDRDGLGDVPGL
jgi:hypothetical protein